MAKEAPPQRSKDIVDRGTIEHEQALPRRLGRVLSAREFWDQMEQWRVPDDVALELIEFPGKQGGQAPTLPFNYAPEANKHPISLRSTRP